MYYTTCEQIRALGGFTTHNEDAVISGLISRASAIIDSHCGRTFSGVYNGHIFTYGEDTSSERLWLDEDLCEIDSVINGDGVIVTSDKYVTEPINSAPYYAIRLKAASYITWTYTDSPEGAITVSGWWGYSRTPPDDVEQACIRLALALYHQKESTIDSDRPIISDGVVIGPSNLPNDVVTILGPYRKVRLA